MTVPGEYQWIFGLIATGMILSLTALGLILWVAYYLATVQQREARRRLEFLRYQGCLAEATEHISDVDFAQLLAEYFRQVGYSVQIAHPHRDHLGVNLRLLKHGRRIAVRTEKHAEIVGDKAVQDLITGTAFYDADDAWMLTTSSFTDEARELANRMGVRLIDGVEIGTWFTKITENKEPTSPPKNAGHNDEMEAINEARKRALWHPHPDTEPFDSV